MCGITGIVHLDRNHPVKEATVRKMAASIIHRGPDDEGYYMHQNVGLGFRRLSIIDLHTGHQPISNEDDSVWIIFNGEVYNYPELRKDLMARGHVFQTKTDTETIVHLYEEYGKDCVQYLRGMFAFAIWDNRKQKLFCARDRFGIKPFFYYLDAEKLVFGSEIKTILNAGNIPQEIDFSALDSYLAYKYITADRSIYQNIKKLKAAHTLEISWQAEKPQVKIERYWDFHYEPDFSKTEEQWCEELKAVLSESVKMRLISDVPLGAFLSGGIDSSAVVGLMAKHSEQPVKTFSIGFQEKEFNELPYAREVAKMYGTEHFEQIIEPESVSLLPKLVAAYDEPFADSSAIPTYYVSKFAREHVTVVLSGDGGDELFAGYNTYPRLTRLNNYNRLPHLFNKLFWGAVHETIPNKIKGKRASYHLSKKREEVGAYFALWMQTERKKLYRGNLWKDLNGTTAENYKKALLQSSNGADFLFKMQALDMKTYMVDDILTKVDRASMMNSLEARVPILDHKVAELSCRIPSKFKLHGNEKKYIFKKAIGKYLPDSVLNHRKQGFTVPMKLWFKDSLKEYVNDRLNTHNTMLSEYLNMDYVQKIVDDHHNGMRDMNEKIWSLIFLDAWMEHQKSTVA